MHGEDSEDNLTNAKKSFLRKSKKARVLVTIAGVAMNLVLALVAFSIVYTFSGIPRPSGKVTILDVVASSPAQEAGLIAGDVVKKVEGKDIATSDEFVLLLEEKKGTKVALEVERTEADNVQTKKMKVVPRENPPENEGPLGVVVSSTEIYFPPIWQRPFYGVYYGSQDAFFWGKTIVGGLGTMLAGILKGNMPKDVSGPVGIFAITTEAYKVGFLSLLNFVGILSLNLAILNIVPFPALDGGRLFFIGVEAIFGRKILPKVEAAVNAVGMVVLVLLLLAITTYDIKRLIAAGSIDGFLQSFYK